MLMASKPPHCRAVMPQRLAGRRMIFCLRGPHEDEWHEGDSTHSRWVGRFRWRS